MSKDDLLEWADTELTQKAKLAYEGQGSFSCGEWCRFCKAKAECRERAETNLALARYDFEKPALLDDEEITDILGKVDTLTTWAADIKEYALQQAIGGKEWSGWKLVEGRTNRKYTDDTDVASAVEHAGFDPYERKVLGINLVKAQSTVFNNANNAYKNAGLSANEYMETVTEFSASLIRSLGGDERKALDTYMLYGGMPRLFILEDEKDKKDYLTSLYSELYVRDIVERNGIEREDVLNDILDFLASQISSLTNPTNIANAIASMKNEKINPAMVLNYVQYVIDSFLVSMAKRYDVKGKTYFKYPHKYYYTDVGLRNARLNYRQYDPGHIMENIIYNELLRRGYSVDVGVVCDRTGNSKVQKEIDFVVNDADKKIYIQSAFRMDTDKKESSELTSLMLTGRLFQKAHCSYGCAAQLL